MANKYLAEVTRILRSKTTSQAMYVEVEVVDVMHVSSSSGSAYLANGTPGYQKVLAKEHYSEVWCVLDTCEVLHHYTLETLEKVINELAIEDSMRRLRENNPFRE